MRHNCNIPEVYDAILSQFLLLDDVLYRTIYGKTRPIIGQIKHLYRSVEICSKTVPVHNIVAVLKIGSPIPSGMVCDHIDRDKMNNKASNIRVVFPITNNQNIGNALKNSKTGVICIISRRRSLYRVKYKVNRKDIDLGSFRNLEDAVAARDASLAVNAPERLLAIYGC